MGAACLLLPAAALAGERPTVNVECTPTDEKLVFHCTFDVEGRKSRRPVEGAAFKVGADMPSMAMAHNVEPIRPAPVPGKPGSYQGMLALEMLGDWALKITFDEPVRDVVIRKLTFGGPAMAMGHSGHETNPSDHERKRARPGHDD